jgi:hypothetical protein
MAASTPRCRARDGGHVKTKKKTMPVLMAFATKKGRSYTFEIRGSGYSPSALGKLFDAIENTQSDDTLMTFPVIRELEDPKLMAQIDKSIADIESGKSKTVSWEVLKRKLDKMKPAKKKTAAKKSPKTRR